MNKAQHIRLDSESAYRHAHIRGDLRVSVTVKLGGKTARYLIDCESVQDAIATALFNAGIIPGATDETALSVITLRVKVGANPDYGKCVTCGWYCYEDE
jgi:hypothetical protein